MKQREFHSVPYTALAGACLILLALVSCGESAESSALPVVKQVPAFEGRNYDGSSMSPERMRGKVWLASFMFTSCGGPCPILSAELSKLQEFCAELPDVAFVSFTVDPANDTEEVLGRYAERYKARKDMWYFVRMPQPEVAELSVHGFYVGNIDNPAMHSTRFILVDREGNVRGYFDGLDAKAMQDLRANLKTLALENA